MIGPETQKIEAIGVRNIQLYFYNKNQREDMNYFTKDEFAQLVTIIYYVETEWILEYLAKI